MGRKRKRKGALKDYEKAGVEDVKATTKICPKCKKGMIVEYNWPYGCRFITGMYEACSNPNCDYDEKIEG